MSAANNTSHSLPAAIHLDVHRLHWYICELQDWKVDGNVLNLCNENPSKRRGRVASKLDASDSEHYDLLHFIAVLFPETRNSIELALLQLQVLAALQADGYHGERTSVCEPFINGLLSFLQYDSSANVSFLHFVHLTSVWQLPCMLFFTITT